MKKTLNFIKSNPVYLLAIFTIIFAIAVLVNGLLVFQKPPTQIIPVLIFSPSPTSTPSIQDKPEPGVSYQTITETDQEQFRKDALVSQLIKTLPYKGAYFSLYYNYSTNQFVCTLDSNHEAEGSQELDNYLQRNQVSDRSWLKNLVIKST